MQRARQERLSCWHKTDVCNSTIGYPYDTHAADLCSGDRPRNARLLMSGMPTG